MSFHLKNNQKTSGDIATTIEKKARPHPQYKVINQVSSVSVCRPQHWIGQIQNLPAAVLESLQCNMAHSKSLAAKESDLIILYSTPFSATTFNRFTTPPGLSSPYASQGYPQYLAPLLHGTNPHRVPAVNQALQSCVRSGIHSWRQRVFKWNLAKHFHK